MDIEKTADLKCISRLLVEKWHVDQIKMKITVSPPRETFKSISSLEAKPNEEFDYFENVLHAACAEGRTDVVKYLVEKQHMFVDKPDSLGRTPLLIASEGGHTAIATLTGIGCLGIVNMADCDGQAPFHAACATGNVELIELLHRNGANMNGAAEKWIRSDDGCWCKCKLTLRTATGFCARAVGCSCPWGALARYPSVPAPCPCPLPFGARPMPVPATLRCPPNYSFLGVLLLVGYPYPLCAPTRLATKELAGPSAAAGRVTSYDATAMGAAFGPCPRVTS